MTDNKMISINPNKVGKCIAKVNNILEKGRIPYGQKTKITHVSMGGNKGKFCLNKVQRKELIIALAEATSNNIVLNIAEMPKEYGPIIFDIDLEVLKTNNKSERLYDEDMIIEVCEYYIEGIKKYLDVSDEQLKVCIFEKESYKEKDLTIRDGFHGFFHEICTSSHVRYLIRDHVIKKAELSQTFEKFTKSTSDIFDKSIINTNPWLMYGCSKPECQPYKLTMVLSLINDEIKDHGSEYIGDQLRKTKVFSIQQKGWSSDTASPYSNGFSDELINMEFEKLGYNKKTVYEEDFNNLSDVKKDNINRARTLLQLLNDKRSSNYFDWIRIGWALHNIDKCLLPDWIEFSQRCPDKYVEGDCEERWTNMRDEGLTIRSLNRWAKEDNPDEYKKFLANEYESFLMKSLDINTYYIAKALYNKYSDRFVCVSTKNNIWYEFRNHRWHISECGNGLIKLISEDFTNDFLRLASELNLKASKMSGSDKESVQSKASRTQKICDKLLNITYKKQIMEEAKTLFYEADFEQKLDEINVNLIGFENGVYDLDNEEFRAGKPDDYISLSTKREFVDFKNNTKNLRIYFDKIETFFKQIIPNDNVRKYFLLSICSCVSGDTSKEENFRICTGVGSNGKSITFDLLGRALGDYVVACPITIVTRKRNASNQASPELARLKSKRCAIFQETDENESFNVGILKELTGNDKFMVRPMYREPFEVKFQVKWFLSCNQLPDVQAQDEGTWRRLKVIEFLSRFISNPNPKKPNEYPIDPSLKKEINQWAGYFASYLIRLYITEYKHLKMIPEPEEIKCSTNSYRCENDMVNKFINDSIEFSSDSTIVHKDNDIWASYNTWFTDLKDNSTKKMNRTNFMKQLYDAFDKNGLTYYKNKGWQGFTYKTNEESSDDAKKKHNMLEL